MILLKLQFCNAKGLVFNRLSTSTLPHAISLLIAPDDIINIEMSSNKTSDINFLYYDIEPWKLSIKYDSLLPILNGYGHPNSMDLTGILWLFMCYIKYDTTEYPVFIDMSTIDWSVLDNVITFNAYSIVGVVFLYDKTKPEIYIQEQLLLIIPRNIKLWKPADDYINLTPNNNYSRYWGFLQGNHRLYFTTILGTAIVNIFTRNNLGELYNDYWAPVTYPYEDNTVIAYKNYFCVYEKLDEKYFTRVQPISYNNSTNYGSYNAYVSDYGSWPTEVDDIINQYRNVINIILTGNMTYVDNYFESNNIIHGKRAVIDFVNDFNGLTFIETINILYDSGYFTMYPYILNDTLDPGDIDAFQPVIGITPLRPSWLPDTHLYYYRNPANDNKRRRLQLQYWNYVVFRYQNPRYPDALLYRIHQRKQYVYINLSNPNFINAFTDTGWYLRELSEALLPGEAWLTRDKWKDLVYGNLITDYSDDFYRYHSSKIGKIQYSIIDNGVLNSIRLSEDPSNIIYNNPGYIDSIAIINLGQSLNLVFTGISNIDLIKQSLILLNASFIYNPTDGKTLYTNKMSAVGFPTSFSDIYTIALDDVEQYKYIPYIKTKPKNIYEYNVIELNTGFNRLVRSFYNNIINSIKVKITMNVIGDITNTLNMIDFRYFYFQDRIFILTSVKYDTQNNVTNILGFGK